MTRVDYATHESIVAGELQNLDRTLLAFSIGARPYLGKRALSTAIMSWRALKITPSTAVVIHLGGFDDDPRELWDIPEARDFIGRFAEKTQAHKHPAIDPMSRNLLLLCGADPELHARADMITKEQALEQTNEFFKSRIKE